MVTSLLRKHIGFKLWRFIHWCAYLAWPLGLLHGLGTGTDARMAWFLEAQAACVLATWLALVFWRLSFGWPRHHWPRLAAAVICSVAGGGLALFMLNGPLAPGWARLAGTPLSLLQAAHPGAGALHQTRGGSDRRPTASRLTLAKAALANAGCLK